jgi:hypothetical protein
MGFPINRRFAHRFGQTRSSEIDCRVDVAACCSRVGAYLVRFVYDCLRQFPIYTRQADVEPAITRDTRSASSADDLRAP